MFKITWICTECNASELKKSFKSGSVFGLSMFLSYRSCRHDEQEESSRSFSSILNVLIILFCTNIKTYRLLQSIICIITKEKIKWYSFQKKICYNRRMSSKSLFHLFLWLIYIKVSLLLVLQLEADKSYWIQNSEHSIWWYHIILEKFLHNFIVLLENFVSRSYFKQQTQDNLKRSYLSSILYETLSFSLYKACKLTSTWQSL